MRYLAIHIDGSTYTDFVLLNALLFDWKSQTILGHVSDMFGHVSTGE